MLDSAFTIDHPSISTSLAPTSNVKNSLIEEGSTQPMSGLLPTSPTTFGPFIHLISDEEEDYPKHGPNHNDCCISFGSATSHKSIVKEEPNPLDVLIKREAHINDSRMTIAKIFSGCNI